MVERIFDFKKLCQIRKEFLSKFRLQNWMLLADALVYCLLGNFNGESHHQTGSNVDDLVVDVLHNYFVAVIGL